MNFTLLATSALASLALGVKITNSDPILSRYYLNDAQITDAVSTDEMSMLLDMAQIGTSAGYSEEEVDEIILRYASNGSSMLSKEEFNEFLDDRINKKVS